MTAEIEELIPSLNSSDVTKRLTAVNKLCQIKSSRALNLLLNTVKNEAKINIRIAALQGIGTQGFVNKKVEETLQWNARDSNPQVRRASIGALNTLNCPILSKVLLEKLEDFDPNIRLYSIDIIGDKKLKRCTESLISLLKSTNEVETINRVALALGKIQDVKTIQPLIEKLKTGPANSRPHISQALQSFGDNAKKPLLKILSESGDVQLLQLTIGALQNIGGKDVIEPIAKNLSHSNQAVQNVAKKALVSLKGSTRYVIKEFMNNPQNKAIHGALQNQGKFAVESLLKLKDHETNAIRSNATTILNAIVQNYQNVLSSGSRQHKIDATEVYLKLLEKNYPLSNIATVKSQIIKNLSFEDADVQKFSLKALRKIGDANAVDAVESVLKSSSDGSVIKEALRTLGEFQDSKPIGSIKEKTKSQDVEIRKEAVITLGKIGTKNPKLVEDFLSDIVYDPNPEIKLKAIKIAEQLKSHKAIGALKQCETYGATDEIQKTASHALNELQEHFIKILSSSSSKEQLLNAVDGLVEIERANERIIKVLFDVQERIPDMEVRRKAVEALGVLGDESILRKLEEIDISEPRVRAAKSQAVAKIRKIARESETVMDKLRRGEVPDDDVEILRILGIQNHSIFGSYAEDIRNQLVKASEHFENENWGEGLNRINNVCEDIVKEILDKRRDGIDHTVNVDTLLRQDHWNRIQILENRTNFLEKNDPFIIALKSIHLDRIKSEAQHGGGVTTTKSNAKQAIHSLMRIYFKAEELLRAA